MKAIRAHSITPGNRHKKSIQKFLLGKNNKLLKSLQSYIYRCVGRSSLTGQITLWGRGGGCKKLYRHIHSLDTNSLGIILFTTYDPNRSSFISLYFDFLTTTFHYLLAPNNLVSGSIIGCSSNITEFKLGFSYWLANHPNGALFMSLAIKKKKPQYALAAGTFCQLLQKNGNTCNVRLPSNQIISVSSKSYGTLGAVSNKYNHFVRLGKAGRNRLKGKRPHVRGIAMNPVDHPHGGRTNGGRVWVTPWGKPTQGQKTSKNKN